MRSQLPGLVNFTQKSKVRGGSCSDIIERDTQLICRQNKYKVLGLNRYLLTDILTVCQDLWIYFRCLQLRKVLCQLSMLYLLRFMFIFLILS